MAYATAYVDAYDDARGTAAFREQWTHFKALAATQTATIGTELMQTMWNMMEARRGVASAATSIVTSVITNGPTALLPGGTAFDAGYRVLDNIPAMRELRELAQQNRGSQPLQIADVTDVLNQEDNRVYNQRAQSLARIAASPTAPVTETALVPAQAPRGPQTPAPPRALPAPKARKKKKKGPPIEEVD